MNAKVGMVGLAVLLVACWAAGAAGQPPPADTPGTPIEAPQTEPRSAGPGDRGAARVVLEIAAGEATWGRIVLELDASRAPLTVQSFLQYVDAGYYDGTVFHRVLPGFLTQGGGYTAGMEPKREGVRRPVRNEARNGLKNARGTLAMARGRDPHGATTQFFINLADNSKLDHPGHDGWGYCVFGRVVQGMDVVERIASVKTRRDPRGRDTAMSLPMEPPVIRRAHRLGEMGDAPPTPTSPLPSHTTPIPRPTVNDDEDRVAPERLPEAPAGEEPEGTEDQPLEQESPR